MKKNNKIIKCLNNFEAIVEKDLEFIVPLSIKKTDVYIAFEQVKLKMQYINETLIQENSLEELALIIFKLLFLSDNNLNYENLDEKVETFETILKILEGKPDIQKENLLIDSISAEKQEWKDLIDLLSLEFGGFSFIFCVFLKYKNSLEQVVEFFFRFLRVSFDCFVNCDKNMKISEESAAKDLYVLLNEILQDKNAKYELKIVEGKIVKKLISVEELTKLLTLKDDSSFGKIKRLNNVNENKADENKGINKDKDVNLKPNDNNNISEEHEINENGNKISEVQVIKEDTNKISETQVINEVGNKISEAQVIKENVNEMSEVQGKDLINNKFNILEMRIKSLEDEKDENTKIIKNLEVEKVVEPVTDEDVDKQIEAMRAHHANLIDAAEGDTVVDGDFITLDYTGTVDGEKFAGGEAKDAPLDIGSHKFIGDFEEQLIGAKVDEERTVKVTFPEDYHAKNLAGKDAEFACKINSIKHKELPELNDEFVKKFTTFQTLDEYKENIRKSLETNAERRAVEAQRQAVIEKAVENMTVDLPPVMIDNRVAQLINELSAQLKSSGMTLEQYMEFSGLDMDKLRENYRESAKKQVLTDIMLEKVATAEKISVTNEELNYEISIMAQMYRTPQKQIEKYLKDNGQLENIASNILRRKATKFIIDHMAGAKDAAPVKETTETKEN